MDWPPDRKRTLERPVTPAARDGMAICKQLTEQSRRTASRSELLLPAYRSTQRHPTGLPSPWPGESVDVRASLWPAAGLRPVLDGYASGGARSDGMSGWISETGTGEVISRPGGCSSTSTIRGVGETVDEKMRWRLQTWHRCSSVLRVPCPEPESPESRTPVGLASRTGGVCR